ncbi:hypothetical protein ACHAW6_001278 [Cyclotella cf. meneghiniana]
MKREEWLSLMIQKWVTGIEQRAAGATRFPHFAYAGLVLCLSAEWHYIYRMVPDFLPAILGIDDPIDDKLRTLLGNGVKTRGLAIWDPIIAAASLHSTSVEATDMLAGTLIQNEPINVKAHQTCVHTAGAAHRKTRRDGEVAFHTALMEWSPLKVKKGWSVPPCLVRGSQPYRTDSLAPNSPRLCG